MLYILLVIGHMTKHSIMRFAAIKNCLSLFFNQHKNKQALILIIAFTLSNAVTANATLVNSSDYKANNSNKHQHILKNAAPTNRPYQLSVEKLQLKKSLQYNINIIINEPNLIVHKSLVVARISTINNGVNSDWNIKKVIRTKANQWLLELQDDGISSSYKVEFEFKGIDINDHKYQYRTKLLIIEPQRLPITVIKTDSLDTSSHAKAIDAPNKVAIKTVSLPTIPVTQKQQTFLVIQVVTAMLVIIMFASLIFLWVCFQRSQQPLKTPSKDIEHNETSA